MTVPKSHPRYASLKTRDLIVKGVQKGITSIHGLIAQGRGEAFDYLTGEKTSKAAKKSISCAAALLLIAKHPVISVNGNAAILASKELVELSGLVPAPLEINIFHPSKKREIKIKNHLLENGAKKVLLPDKKCKIKFLDSNRKYVNPDGIFKADVVFVPLEDGDAIDFYTRNMLTVLYWMIAENQLRNYPKAELQDADRIKTEFLKCFCPMDDQQRAKILKDADTYLEALLGHFGMIKHRK